MANTLGHLGVNFDRMLHLQAAKLAEVLAQSNHELAFEALLNPPRLEESGDHIFLDNGCGM